MHPTGPASTRAFITATRSRARATYFGSVINLTARLLSAAERDELVATRPVGERCPEVTWQPGGTRYLRGVERPGEVFKLLA